MHRISFLKFVFPDNKLIHTFFILLVIIIFIIMPYFFASGHVNYARFVLYYLRSIKRLPIDVARSFLKGEHVMHHNKRYLEWNLVRHVR